jgi:hypothetical protein
MEGASLILSLVACERQFAVPASVGKRDRPSKSQSARRGDLVM